MNLEKEYLKGNKMKLNVARTFTAVVILCCVFYSIGISNWVNNAAPEQDYTYYADPDMVQNSVYDPHGVLKNATLNTVRSQNRNLMEQYYVRAIVALVDQTELAGRDVGDYTVGLFESGELGWNDTLIVITADRDYWVEFGKGIYNHAISDKNYAGDYFDKLEGYIDSGDLDGAITFHVDRTTAMYDNYDALTDNLSYNYSYSSYDYYGAEIFTACIIIAVIIIFVAAIASSGGRGRRYRYVTYYPHRRKFRPNYYNFYRYQNRHHVHHHMHGGFWGPGSQNKWSHPNNSWQNNNSNRNNAGGGFGSKGGQSNNKPGGWSSSGRTNSGGGFGRSSGSSGRSGGGFGKSSGGGRGSSGGGFGRKK